MQMEFDDSPEEAAFRDEARSWLDTVAKRRDADDARSNWQDFRAHTEEQDRKQLVAAKEWQAMLCDEGWAGLHWPTAHGGRGLSPHLAAIFSEELSHYDTYSGFFMIGIDMVGPTLMAHGTAEQQDRFLKPMLRGEEVWCQLFSEPGAGSDLAGLQTKAVRDGDEFVVNGQKVWTSSAHIADMGMLLARTNPGAPKHEGITYFLLDMHTPGIEVRPLRQIDGAIHFNEVFLTDVRVPADRVVGDVDGGWRVALTTLTAERTAIGGGGRTRFTDVLDHARAFAADAHAVWRQDLARLYTRYQLLRWLNFRVRTSITQGRQPGPESSVLKLLNSQQVEHLGNLAVGVMGAAGTLGIPDAKDGGFWQGTFLSQWSSRIGGGTEQVQRNIISERVLGLPKEPR